MYFKSLTTMDWSSMRGNPVGGPLPGAQLTVPGVDVFWKGQPFFSCCFSYGDIIHLTVVVTAIVVAAAAIITIIITSTTVFNSNATIDS